MVTAWDTVLKYFDTTGELAVWAADPAQWAKDRLGVHLWSKQREIFQSVTEHRRTAVRSCHGSGKSFSAGALAAWWVDIHPPGEAIVVSCYTDDTEVLTRAGWKNFQDVNVGLDGDEFATRNPETHEFEWQHAFQYHKAPYKGDVVDFKGRTTHLRVTPNHRMVVRWNEYKDGVKKSGERFKRADAITKRGANLPTLSVWKGETPDTVHVTPSRSHYEGDVYCVSVPNETLCVRRGGSPVWCGNTAPTYKQVHAVLWEEIRKQHRQGNLPGRITQTDEWSINDILVGMGRKPKDHDAHGFQGIHRRYVLAILDEACGIPDALWVAVEAITTNDDCRILAIGNPDDPNTTFGKVFRPGSAWNKISISAFDTPNFTGEYVPDEMRRLLPSPDWVSDAGRAWGLDSPLYASKVLGEFPESSNDTLIPSRFITDAGNRDLDPTGAPIILGVDVARFGTDKTVVCALAGGNARIVETFAKQSTTETTGAVINLTRQLGNVTEIRIDGVGVGGGVVDQLTEYRDSTPEFPRVLDLQAGSAATDTAQFNNARAEWYWSLRKRFEEGDIDVDPDDNELLSQLASLRYKFTSRGKVQIESKDDMKARGMPSPDRADALMMAAASINTPTPEQVLHAEDLLEDWEEEHVIGWE